MIEVSSAVLRGIWLLAFSIASLTRRCLYPLFIRCVVSALESVLKNSSVEQILLSRTAMLKAMDCLVWDGWQDEGGVYFRQGVGGGGSSMPRSIYELSTSVMSR